MRIPGSIRCARAANHRLIQSDGTHDSVVDGKYIQSVKSRIAELREQQEAQPNESTSRELQQLIQLQKRDQARAGRIRAFSRDVEKARKAITNNITRVRNRIKSENEDLWRHLQNAVHTGAEMYYSPDQPITWSVVI